MSEQYSPNTVHAEAMSNPKSAGSQKGLRFSEQNFGLSYADRRAGCAAPNGRMVVERSPIARAPQRVYDIFDRGGKHTASLAVNDNSRIVAFGHRSVYVAVTNDTGVQRLQRHPW